MRKISGKGLFYAKCMVVSLLCAFSMAKVELPAFADTEEADLIQDGVIDEEKYEEEYVMTGIQLYAAGKADIASARDVVYQALLERKDSVSVSAYHLTADEVSDIFSYVINHHPELFYVSSRYSYSYSSYVETLNFSYLYSGEELEERIDAFNAEAEKIMAGINEDWSDLEKAVYVYDYFCTHYEYDTNYNNYDAGKLFVDKTAVCQGYFLGYEYIMNLLGIENEAAESDSMNHIWNQIKINGKWYNVDVTWGDPIYDRIGRADHGNFLKSDSAFINNYEHYDWSSSNTCTDTTYDSAFWNNVSSPFAYLNGTWYCLSNDKMALCTCNINSPKINTTLKTLPYWYQQGSSSSYYVGVFSGLGAYGDKLYYNTSSAIMSYAPATGKSETVMNGRSTLYGSYLDENIIKYGYATSPSSKVSVSGEYTLPIVVVTVNTTGVSLSQSSLSLYVGEEVQLTATVSPSDATNKNVRWSSSDPSVAMVDSDGIINAMDAGTATITVTTVDTGKTATCTVTVSRQAGWQQEAEGFRYVDENGEYVISQWISINDEWYYFGSDGYMVTGWHKEGSTWYYLKDDGTMAKDEWVEDGKYYIDSKGKLVTAGWQHDSKGWWYQCADGTCYKNQWKLISGKWYYFKSSGYAQTGWYKEGDAWYYFKADCSMAVSESVDDGKYYVGADGKMITAGWQHDSKGWWYQNADGTYPKNAWKKIGNKWYHFDKNGYMQTGWYKQGSYYYYLKADGSMAADEWVGSYYIDSNGHWVE